MNAIQAATLANLVAAALCFLGMALGMTPPRPPVAIAIWIGLIVACEIIAYGAQ